MSLSAYTILMHPSEAPGRTLRITELADRAYLSGSRTTRLVDELLAAGYATKQRCTTDGRGFDVGLTESGLDALEHAYPIHLRSVRARMLGHVDQSAMPCFAEVLTSIASSLESQGSPGRIAAPASLIPTPLDHAGPDLPGRPSIRPLR